MLTIYDQIISFFVTIGIGFLAGILFDIYRVVRSMWKPRKIGTYIGDILFWIVLTFIVFFLLLIGNWGELRIYVFLGIILGYLVYAKKCSKKAQIIIKKTFSICLKIARYLWLGITWPFKITFKIFLIPLGFVVSGFVGVAKIITKGYSKVSNKLKHKIKGLFSRPPKNEE